MPGSGLSVALSVSNDEAKAAFFISEGAMFVLK